MEVPRSVNWNSFAKLSWTLGSLFSAVLVVLVHLVVGVCRAVLGGGELLVEVLDERGDGRLHGEDAARREGEGRKVTHRAWRGG